MQTFGRDLPADAVVLAGPTADGSVLLGWKHGRKLCTVVRQPGADRQRGSGVGLDALSVDEPECDPLPVLAAHAHRASNLPFADNDETQPGGSPVRAWGVAGTGIATVELTPEHGVPARAPTMAVPEGFGELRAYLVQGPPQPYADVRFLGADGAVRSVDDIDLLRIAFPPLRRTVARGRFADTPWRLITYQRRFLEPTPLDPARRLPATCVGVRVGRPGVVPDVFGLSPACATDRALEVNLQPDCDRHVLAVPIVAHSPAASVLASLGDGQRRVVRLHALPGDPAVRGGVLLVDAGVAVRRVEATTAEGRTTAAIHLGLAPIRVLCDSSAWTISWQFGDSSDHRPPPAPGTTHVVMARDRGDQLCLALDESIAVRETCRVPPVDLRDVVPQSLPGARQDVVAAPVPTDVASAVLLLDDGTTLDANAAPVAGYAGKYVATTQVVRWDVPRRRQAVAFRLRDDRHRIIWRGDGPSLPVPTHRTLLLHGPAGTRLSAAVFPRTAWGRPSRTCITLVAPGYPSDCELLRGAAVVSVDCATRRTVVAALLDRPSDRVLALSSGGRAIPAPTRRLPAGLGGGAGALVVLSPSVGLRALEVHHAHGRVDRVAFRLPAGRQQCGYTASQALV